MPPVSAIQRLPEHELTAVSVIAQIQPVIDFTPILGALCDSCAGRSRVDAPDHDVHAVKPAFRIKPLWDSLPVKAPEKVQTVGEDNRLAESYLGPTKWLAHTVRWGDDIGIEQRDVESLWMSVR